MHDYKRGREVRYYQRNTHNYGRPKVKKTTLPKPKDEFAKFGEHGRNTVIIITRVNTSTVEVRMPIPHTARLPTTAPHFQATTIGQLANLDKILATRDVQVLLKSKLDKDVN